MIDRKIGDRGYDIWQGELRLTSPITCFLSHWATEAPLFQCVFRVGSGEEDRQVQFGFIAGLLIDLAVHKLHAVSLRPPDLLPVYHHTKVTFSVAPGSAIWASWEASWKVFTNEVSYYTASLLTFWCLKGFHLLLSLLVFEDSRLRIALIVKYYCCTCASTIYSSSAMLTY